MSAVSAYSQLKTPVDSLDIYDPFTQTDAIRRIINNEFSTLGKYHAVIINNCLQVIQDSSSRNYLKVGNAHLQMGDVYFRSAMYNKALDSYFQALAVFEKAHDSLKSARAKIKIGRTYYFADVKPKRSYFAEAAEILKKFNSPEAGAALHYILGLLDTDATLKTKHFTRALELQRQVLVLRPEDIEQREYLSNYLNGNGNFEEAIQVAETLPDQWFLVLYLNNLGAELVEKKEFARALAIFTRSHDICIRERYKTLLRNVYENIAKVYRGAGNWERSTHYLQMMKLVTESLYLEQFSMQVSEMEVKYESVKKDLENRFLRKEKEIFTESITHQRNLSLLLYIMVFTVSGALVIVFFGNRRLKRINMQLDQRNAEILRKQEELSELYQTLLENEKNLKDAQATAHLANWEFNYKTKEVKFSDQFPVIFGMDAGQLHDNGFELILHAVCIDSDAVNLAGFLGIKRIVNADPVTVIRILAHDGIKWIKLKKVIHRDEIGAIIKLTGTVQDITETKLEEENRIKITEQKSYTKELIKYQEDERKRLAGELHDGLGQDLLLVKNRALLALQNQELDEFSKLQLQEISTTTSTILDSIRALSFELRPVHIERLGLSEIITASIEKMNTVSSINFRHRIENVEGFLNNGSVINVFRIIQEAVSNIVKYSRAAEAMISLQADDQLMTIIIKDDGIGFDYEKTLHEARGFGLKSIITRVEMVKGTIRFTTAPHEGCTIIITIPKDKNE